MRDAGLRPTTLYGKAWRGRFDPGVPMEVIP